MKGIYLTEQTKQEIEAKIAEIKNYTYATQNIWIEGQNSGMLKILEEILASATILPVEESWEEFHYTTNPVYNHFKSTDKEYPNGVIIQPKQ